MKTVCTFPGQGSQHRGMGEALFDRYRDLLTQADGLLGYSLRELCLEDSQRVLSRTDYAQPALYVVGALSYLDWLRQGGAVPDYVAGHSLGEYCALFAAEAFDFITGLKLVMKRGELMSRAPKGAMAAILNIDQPTVENILAALPHGNLDIANINSRKQCVISGIHDELFAEDVAKAFSDAGGTFFPLNVSAAFHSRCMREVEAEFGEYLAGFEFRKLQIPVVANYTARPYPATDFTDLLRLQISNPVRWYESVSWLIAEGCGKFVELGAGDVLTKLHAKIVHDPLLIPANTPATPDERTSGPARRKTKLIFMYAGQGSQYFQMGRELFETNSSFQAAMRRCDREALAISDISLISVLYGNTRNSEPFVNIRQTGAALYSIGYALTETMIAEGFEPDGVLGHSMGEYIAAAVAGAMDWREGLSVVLRQAALLEPLSGKGGLLSVLASPDLFLQDKQTFAHLTLAGVNYEGNFVVSGESAALDAAHSRLDSLGHVALRLPVPIAFHADQVDVVKNDFLAIRVAARSPSLPIYSAAHGRCLEGTSLDNPGQYFWEVIRGRIKFEEVMNSAFSDEEDYYFVDLSATGSFANFLKYGYNRRYRCKSAINQFGNNRASLKSLTSELAALC